MVSTLVFRLGMLAVELILAPSPMHLVNTIIYDYIYYTLLIKWLYTPSQTRAVSGEANCSSFTEAASKFCRCHKWCTCTGH